MSTQKVLATLEASPIQPARRTAGPRGLPSYIDAALAEKLERDEQRAAPRRTSTSSKQPTRRLTSSGQQSAGRRTPSGIDAIVAAHAAEAGRGVVFTTDPADLRRLLVDFPRITIGKP